MMIDIGTESTLRKVAALTVAGSDSGGNAGIQADLRAFQTFGVHGCSAITALTAQNPFKISGVVVVDGDFVTEQIEAVIEIYDIKALKTGMLCSSDIIRSVSDALTCYGRILKVVDPVMIATSGAKLLEDDAIETMKSYLLPLADLITPNIPEAEELLKRKLSTEKDIQEGARELFDNFGCAILIKGGHGHACLAKDLFLSATESAWLESPVVEDPLSTHGTGCSLSAAITASLACGNDLLDAVVEGKAYVYEAIRTGMNVGECASVLGTPGSLPLEAITVNCKEYPEPRITYPL